MRKTITAVLLLAVAACAPAPARQKVVANPDYVIIRQVGMDPSEGSASAQLDGKTYYFNPAERVVDLRGIAGASVQQSSVGGWEIFGTLSPDGGRAFGAWSGNNIGRKAGIFVNNRLVSAPTVRSRITEAFVIEGEFTKMEAEEIAARLRAGGR